MQIRRLGPSDTADVLGAAHPFDEPSSAEAVAAYLRDERNIFLLALDGLMAVGFLRGTELGQLKSNQRQMFL